MDDEARQTNAIVPEESGELTLPSEMIHRGFELAAQIERKQGIQATESPTMAPFHKGHLVRGYICFMEWYRDPQGVYKLKEPEKGESYPPVSLWASFDLHGLHFTCASKDELPAIRHLEGNEARYRLLNEAHDTNPFTVPVSSFGLYYKIIQAFRPDRYPPGMAPRVPKEEWKNFHFELGPQGAPGYVGAATKEANRFLRIEEDCLEIVLIYISLIGDADEKGELVRKNPPVKLSFTVVDLNGENDLAETHDLYQAMFEARKQEKRFDKIG